MAKTKPKSKIYTYLENQKVDLVKSEGNIEVWHNVVRLYPRALAIVPKAKHTHEMVLHAIESEALTIQFANESLIDEEMALTSVERDCRAITFLPEKAKDARVIFTAINEDGLLLEKVSEEKQTEKIALAAVKNNGLALQFVSPSLRSAKICETAFISNPISLGYSPTDFWTKSKALTAARAASELSDRPAAWRELYRLADTIPDELVSEEFIIAVCALRGKNALLFNKEKRTENVYLAALEAWQPIQLHKIPRKAHTEAIVKRALENNPEHIKYVAKAFDTEEMHEYAASLPPRKFWWDGKNEGKDESVALIESPEPIKLRKTRSLQKYIDLLLHCLENEDLGSNLFSDGSLLRDSAPNCAYWENKFVLWLLVHFDALKVYDKEISLDGKNCVARIKLYDDYNELFRLTPHLEEVSFSSISELSSYLNGDLSGTGFDGYDDSLEEEGGLESHANFFNYLAPSYMVEKTDDVQVEIHTADTTSELGERNQELATLRTESFSRTIYYVTDIHIDHNLIQAFPKGASVTFANAFIHKTIKKMFGDNHVHKDDYLLIGGDVADKFPAAELFYRNLVELTNGANIVAILGNHELWDFGPNNEYVSRGIDETVSKYRSLLNELGIHLLENEVLTLGGAQHGKIYSEEELNNIDLKELIELGQESQYLILGGIGYTGYCEEFNATHGIYREAMSDRGEDIKRADRFNRIHKKLNQVIPNRKVIVFSHTPTSNWTTEKLNPNWIYVRGHTHRNLFRNDGEAVVYADNQTGYKQAPILKYFTIDVDYSPFRNFSDGMYEITRRQYIAFSRSRSIDMTFTRDIDKLFLLKRGDTHMFLCTLPNSNKLYLLDGGRIVTANHNLEYYFENMLLYLELVKAGFAPYEKALDDIAASVRSFGGWGIVHGCIVDIDFYNHIYLNPFDGKATPYFAYDMQQCVAYESVGALLNEHLVNLLPSYLKYLRSEDSTIDLLEPNKALAQKKATVRTGETIYSVSRKMSKVRYIFSSDVIRFWSDEPLRTQIRKPSETEREYALPAAMLQPD